MDRRRGGNGAKPLSGTKQPKTVKLSFRKLEDLIDKTPEQILFTLRSEHNGFYGALNENAIPKDKMALILIAVGKACKCDERHTVRSILNKFNSSSKFIYGNIQKYLCSLQNDGYDNRHLLSLSYLILILEELHRVLRAASSDTVSVLLPLFKTTVQKICSKENSNSVLSETLQKIEELENDNDDFIELHFSGKDKSSEVSVEEKPPDDFREIPILPRSIDIFLNSDPYLRPAIKGGCYRDANHYLDVHFRLLHEDVIRPLREGIQEYLTTYQKGNVKKPVKDVKLYRNVHIEKPVMLMSGLTHLISFEAKPFGHVVWENSKRLLFGSLLCLSHDNFQTMLFATVARRDSTKLKNGLLEIQFENPQDVFKFDTATSFVMMETNAYFEAYRHVLMALQEMKEDTFPLKEYIVEVKTGIEPPQYLTRETTYNFQSLVVPNFPNEQNSIQEVTVLDTEKWPSSELLGLDQHQMNALKTALTNKLAIIQGPPGTGKTYIGLKIVELLLNNCHIWNSLDELSPMLVVCYTNHALDQFLEGILSFTDSVVRVGGRSTSPIMNAYQLNTLRAQLKHKHKVPNHIFHNINESKCQLRSIQQKVAATERLIEAAKTTILTVEVLKNYMKPEHYHAFIIAAEKNFSPTLDKSTIIYDWLGLLYSKNPFIFENNEESVDFDDVTETNDLEDTADTGNEEEADVEYVTDQRIVDVQEQELDNQEMIGNHALGTDIEKIQKLEEQMDNDWRVQGGYKERKQFIKKQLQMANKMMKEEADSVESIWDLDYGDRWKLYRVWIDEYVKQNVNNILESQEIYEQFNKEYEEIRVQEDIHLMHSAKVVGMTTSGAAKYRNIVQKIKPPIIIVEEAAEVLEAHIITSLTTSTQHLILIGDHQQLRPSPTVYELAKNYNLNISLFERMIKNGMNYSKLLVQHRMRPCISGLLVPHIYKTLYNHSSVEYKDILGMEKNVFFVNHDFMESAFEDSKSRCNLHEAEFLIGLCRYLLLQGYRASQITILTMYTGQMFLIKKRVTNIFQGVRVSAVDNFQGEENDIILVSFVRSNEEGNIGFLSVSNRICVALSRAKKGLYCIGNFSLFAENNETWQHIMASVTENDMKGEALTLKCQLHQKKKTEIVNGKDFTDNAPEGGCNSLCDFRLACGHVCTLSCHPYDREHKNFKCIKDCPKQCSNGHKCLKKCFEDCGPCLSIVRRQIPSCKHYISIPCSVNPADAACTEPCPSYLPCGHRCQGTCGKPCLSCNVKIKSLALCGHEVEIMCSRSNDEWEKLNVCKKPCNTELDCGHLCKGNCSLCVQFRFHISCAERCNRILVCGHECRYPCARNCPPCTRKCENRCIHSRCPATCCEKCAKCNEKCKWRCQHFLCTQSCGDKCDRVPCDKPCQKKLKCGHHCIGLCGEQCPQLCRICDEMEVKEIFFGNEDEPDARFVQLEDCSHIFEVSGLTCYMEMENTNEKREVQMKSCPKCKTVIRRSLRFGNIIKSCLQEVEMVKEKVFGSTSDNKEKQKTLLERARQLDTEKQEIKSTLHELKNVSTCQINLNRIDSIILKILCQLDEAKSLNAQSLIDVDNYLTFFGDLVMLCKRFLECNPTIQNHKHSVEIMIWNFFSITIQTVLRVMNENESPTDQILYDINQEIQRLTMFVALFQLIAKMCGSSNKSEDFLKFYNKAVCKLLAFRPLTDDDVETAKACIVEASKHSDCIVLGISDEERKSIVKAMGLSKGHWFTCPNGHVYCITECGGAMEQGRCNECQATIGGRNHTLREDNRLARAMDNARHAAWSDAANMLNYDFNHLDI